MKDLKSPLRYPGGKSKATNFLFDDCNMPINKISAYREPFLGGGSCAFAFTKMYPDIPVWVNDKYYNLYCFWMTPLSGFASRKFLTIPIRKNVLPVALSPAIAVILFDGRPP